MYYKQSLFLTGEEGDIVLIEIEERRGRVKICIGDKYNISVSPEEAFDLVDALTLVVNGITTHEGVY